jgi:acetylornithine deacetylase
MPHEIEEGHALVQTLAGSAKDVMGGVRISGFPAGCDARHFAMHGIPAVIFGPGDLRNAHSVDEYVPVDEYLKCLETLAHTIVDWCGVL